MILFSIDIGIVNLAYVILVVNENHVNILHWEVISLCPPKTLVKNISLIDIGKAMQKEFDTRFENKWKDLTIDYVLIENQIGPLALRMKMLQGMITQYFIQNNCRPKSCFDRQDGVREVNDVKTDIRDFRTNIRVNFNRWRRRSTN